MKTAALQLLDAVGGFATATQLMSVMTRQELDVQVRKGGLVRVWYGIYAATDPNLIGRLRALDLRGIRTVRELMEFADGRAESAMESEARLVMIDGGLPRPELQYTIAGRHGETWRVDFAWPDARVAAESTLIGSTSASRITLTPRAVADSHERCAGRANLCLLAREAAERS